MVIQIDDAHPSNGTNTAILLNGKPLELLEAYDKSAIESFFITLENRDAVKIYVSDLAPFLLSLGKKYFPGALRVGDPYHVVRHLLEAFDNLLEPYEGRMLAEYKGAIDARRVRRPFRTKRGKRKQSGRKQDKTSKEPTFAEIRFLLHTREKKLRSLKAAVNSVLNGFPEVRAGYAYLQGVMTLFHTRMSSAEASTALDELERDLIKKLPPPGMECMFKFLDLCRKHRDAMCAFWACGWTNAEAESQNRVIKEIDRCGRGLKFPELRRRWLYGQSASTILGRAREAACSGEKKQAGLRKKGIREIRALPSPEPVSMVGPMGEGWLFDLQDNGSPKE